MKLTPETKPQEFSLFAPESALPTEERTQFRARANDVFAGLSRDNVAPSTSTSSMLPPPPRLRLRNATVNVTPSSELYASLVCSDKVPTQQSKATPAAPEQHCKAFTNKRCFRAQHEISPNKFTKYTLQDVDIADDRQNKAIALDFLQDLKENKCKEADTHRAETEVASNSGKNKKITFNKRSSQDKEQDIKTTGGMKHNKNAIVQEEYVVGQTKSRSKRTSSHDVTNSRDVTKSRDVIAMRHRKSGVAACYLDDDEEED